MAVDATWLEGLVRDVPDFPKPGVMFKDMTPLWADVSAFRFAVDAIADHFAGVEIDRVIGIEARGFILAAPVAYRFGASFVPVRKAGKLPGGVASEEYVLEYGTDKLEVHRDGSFAGRAGAHRRRRAGHGRHGGGGRPPRRRTGGSRRRARLRSSSSGSSAAARQPEGYESVVDHLMNTE